MSSKGKRYQGVADKRDRQTFYNLDDALQMIKDTASAKFDESVDVAINLGVNAKKSDQSVRGATVLPRGTGKTMRVAVFADGADADSAREAGADLVGLDDLAESIQGGEINFDVCIATPATMRVVGKLGQVLGPRGLMPNPKVGTVTQDVTKAVQNAKAGQVQFRIDKAGVIHCPIGKASFEQDALKENLLALVSALEKAKPSSAKGQFLKKVTLSTTMGPGVKVDRTAFVG
ncbi:MAG: 50S ribosomal protein L1 [Proteobacteria bacterium]|jgi:large subunit ribosomal protein L1|nr:50S ribosomal protein L1 [Pseudomonadota bacterium]MBP09967.1 50S ribosomal protein L1 [Acidiferrobacteraceae bacterium]MDP6137566.1 50S ribosomal protein L1 [Arenicellales bacterium]HCF75135.1 50S ribosomal protein L1 [Gammaproteobacteria bacterium]MDP7221367.1 50S ribosomal protein L1 [Arenicellales bacterium]|tara:strand:- start:13118 stop:13813 length:696 start_codon:yes stop_codon:yes gene_type:complete